MGTSHSLSASEWLALQTREIESLEKGLEVERKGRSKREFVLVITCLLAFLYTYPVSNWQANPEIDIPSVSLKIPLKEAVTVFPTLVAAICLVFLASAIAQSSIMLRLTGLRIELSEFRRTGKVPVYDPSFRAMGGVSLRYLLLPSPLHARFPSFGGPADIARLFVELFVGIIFLVLPYLTSVFVTYKGWKLIGSRTALGWNTSCIFIMCSALRKLPECGGILPILGLNKCREFRFSHFEFRLPAPEAPC